MIKERVQQYPENVQDVVQRFLLKQQTRARFVTYGNQHCYAKGCARVS